MNVIARVVIHNNLYIFHAHAIDEIRTECDFFGGENIHCYVRTGTLNFVKKIYIGENAQIC